MAILATMVRYKTPFAESQTLRGVCHALANDVRLRRAYRLLVCDNSPEELRDPLLPIPFDYMHSRWNLGVSSAFNCAMQYASKRGDSWLLLLDQDTRITAPFLRAMLHWSRQLASCEEIALIAPTVYVNNHVVSPRRYLFNYHQSYPDTESGVASGNPFAINSGCIVRTSALRDVGGFNTDFWLDYSDIELCHRFHLRGYKLWRAANAELQHEMSIMDYDRFMTPERYTNYSYAETAFNDIYKGPLENMAQTARLLLRSIRQRRRYTNPEFSRITLAQLAYRLRVHRQERIRQYLAGAESRRHLYAEEQFTWQFADRESERKAL